jgi:hypothetical protein
MQNDPTLEDLLAEPIVRMLMASDRVSAHEVRRLMDEARRRLCEVRTVLPPTREPRRAGMR